MVGEEVYLAVDPDETDGIYVFASALERDRFFDAWTAEGREHAYKSDEPILDGAAPFIEAIR